MRKTILCLMTVAAVLATALPAHAQYRRGSGGNALRFRLGLFQPKGDSRYWNDSADIFGMDASDFDDAVVGADFRYSLGGRSAILFSLDTYEGSNDLSYLDYLDAGGHGIFHTTTLDISSATAGYMLLLAPPGARIVPYVAVGGGLYFWTLEETGDFVDFSDPNDLFLFTDTFKDDGEVLGYYGLVGAEVPLGPRWGFFVEGRWQRADDELSKDFAGLGKLDLSGRQISGGFSWRF